MSGSFPIKFSARSGFTRMFVSNILAVKDTGFFYSKINGYNRKPDLAILATKIEKQNIRVKKEAAVFFKIAFNGKDMWLPPAESDSGFRLQIVRQAYGLLLGGLPFT